MINLNDMLDLAYSQIGTGEDPPGSNRTKYNIKYYGYDQPAEWCAIFCWWLCWALGDADFYCGGNRYACCDDAQDWARDHGRLTESPHVGDWVLFDWDSSGDADHIGLVVEVHDGYITTIEGNCDNKVMLKDRSDHILGYIRNSYGSSAEDKEDDMIFNDLPMLSVGSSGAAVTAWQGIVGAVPDGEFGPDTERLTIQHQKEWFSDSNEWDGVVGPKTWRQGLYSLV